MTGFRGADPDGLEGLAATLADRARELTVGSRMAHTVLVEHGRDGRAGRIAVRLLGTGRDLGGHAADLMRRAEMIRDAERLAGVTSVPALVVEDAVRAAEFALVAEFDLGDWGIAYHRWRDGPAVTELQRLDQAGVAAAFAGASPRAHLELATAFPVVIGALDGAPPEARYAANRILLRGEIDRLQQQRAELEAQLATGTTEHRAGGVWGELRGDLMRRRLDDVDAAVARYRTWMDEGRQILLFDPAGDGRVVEVFGDVSTAEHVAVVVPGIRNDIDGFGPPSGGGFRDDGRLLYEAATRLDPSVATIAWLGYDTPDGVDALVRSAAEAAHGELTDFVDGLVALGDRHVTVIGHSYGSLVTGMAARERLAADEIIFIGSPGTSLDHAGDANTPPGGEVWAGLATWDLIGAGVRPMGDGWIESSMSIPARYVWDLVTTGDPAVEDLWHGTNPAHRSFGAIEFTTDGATGHSQYFDPGTDSLENLARIVAGLTPSVVMHSFQPMELAPGPFGVNPIDTGAV